MLSFELLPVIDRMLELYQKPRDLRRFQEYLQVLQGDTKGDLSVPIGGFNPMGKAHVTDKLKALQALGAEDIMRTTLAALNGMKWTAADADISFKVALNLADDLQGGWTNRYTTDYGSKFTLNALVNRRFIVPLFWVSEPFDAEMIRTRTRAYCYRTIHWLSKPKPATLEEHVEQEKYVCRMLGVDPYPLEAGTLFEMHRLSTDHSLIFNFLYGDQASETLGFATYGHKGYLNH